MAHNTPIDGYCLTGLGLHILLISLIGLGTHVTLVAGCSVAYSHAHTVVLARTVITLNPRNPAPALHILARRRFQEITCMTNAAVYLCRLRFGFGVG